MICTLKCLRPEDAPLPISGRSGALVYHQSPPEEDVSFSGTSKAAEQAGLRWMGTSASSFKEVVHGM